MEKKLKKKQILTIEMSHWSDGTVTMGRSNDGFTLIELLGIGHFLVHEMNKTLAGEIKPDVITREVTIDVEVKSKEE